MPGRAYDHVVGCDLDKVPHLAGAVFEVYEKPVELARELDADPELAKIPSGVPLYWVVNEPSSSFPMKMGSLMRLRNSA